MKAEEPQTQMLRQTAEDVLTTLAWSDKWGRKVLPHINLRSWASNNIYRDVAEKLIKHWHKHDKPPLGHISTLFAKELEGKKAAEYTTVLRHMKLRSETAQYDLVIEAVQEHERRNLAISNAAKLADAALAGDSETLDQALEDIKKVDGVRTQLTTISFDKIEPRRQRWMWWPFFPRTLTLLAGDGGQGKSTIAIDLAARITKGSYWPVVGSGDREKARKGSVLILSAEEDPYTVIQPKLVAAGADLTKVHIVGRAKKPDDMESFQCIERIDTKLGELEEAVKKIGDVRLIILDPVLSYMGDVDTNSDPKVRTVLDPLNTLASKHNLTVLAILHLNKKSDVSARSRISASAAFVNASRSAMMVGPSRDEPAHKIITIEKSNFVSTAIPHTLGFELEPTRQGGLVVKWGDKWLDQTSADIIVSKPKGDTKGHAATELIRELLEEGPMLAKEIFERAADKKISERTVKTAKGSLPIRTYKTGGRWYWKLSENK